MRSLLVGIAVGAALLGGTSAASAGPSYADANRAYKAGEWQRAAEQYEALVGAGIVHPSLYYNLGNAHFRLGRLGPAIYNYERALRLDPGFGDARDNLALAREVVAARSADRLQGTVDEPLWTRLVTYLPIGQLTILFALFDCLLFGGLIARHFLSTGFARAAVTVECAFTAVALMVVGVALAGHVYLLERHHVGIVVDDAVQMHEGTDLASAERELIHAGLRVEITGREPGWLRIELANGLEGWVSEGSIGEL